MTSFEKHYQSLNNSQKRAVDAIDGPVMVVAGPGTGKTELLSVRVANILKKTDALPQNILCLTFTDSGAIAMRERLAGLIGPEAYKVAIHTFHSFGTEIINQYGQFFYHGAHFRPADELSTYEILAEILEKLPHDNPVASTMNGAYTHLKDLLATISDLKKGGLTPDELTAVLDRNDAFCAWIEPHLQTAFGPTLSKKQFPAISDLLRELENYNAEPLDLIGYEPLNHLTATSLQAAYIESDESSSTKPLTVWKRRYLTKNSQGRPVLKDAARSIKLRATVHVYYQYLVAMQDRELFDYDDMILRVVHALEVFDSLRYELQETYQYILVDEFQDTNDAQMRLVWNLTNNPVLEGRPNLLVVGDDDQAIYRFQGATMSNVLDFTKRYQDVTIISLLDNYRSASNILSVARAVIVQGNERLETSLTINKTPTPHHSSSNSKTVHYQYQTAAEARHQLAQIIRDEYKVDATRSRAIIARNHRQLVALLPHLQASGLPLRYERQDNILDSEPIAQLELAARVVHAIAEQRFDEANSLLPELLAHPAWQIPAKSLWELSLNSYKRRVFWLEEMLETKGKLHEIAEWLIVASHQSQTESLEYMCDLLFGTREHQQADTPHDDGITSTPTVDEEFIAPYRAYFFPSESLDTHPGQYLAWLLALQKFRNSLRDFHPNSILKLSDMIEFIDLHREMELTIQSGGNTEQDSTAINLLTAHKSKGLEFDDVYIIDAQEDIWGSSARSRSRLIQFPENLPLAPAGDNDDERLRLLYVAMTRAKDTLSLYSAQYNDVGKAILPIGSIPETALSITPQKALSVATQVETALHDWRIPLYDVPMATKDQLLRPLLDTYKLSATHLNNYLDVTRGGPQLFLLNNLLRFPQAMNPSAVYGSAIHATLQRAHAHLSANGKLRPTEDVLHDFEQFILESHLTREQAGKLLIRGSKALEVFLQQRYHSFQPSQLVERSFGAQSIRIGEAVITGTIDLIDIDTDEKTIFITDYKTGKPSKSWRGRTEYEKIKLHHYEQQLMMYKLLVENSRQFVGYTVTGARLEFVEPDEHGEVAPLDYTYDNEKLTRLECLVKRVWSRIQNMNFDHLDDYESSYKGIMELEDDLVNSLQLFV